MKITSAEFLVSSTRVSDCPKDELPEYAFIGRSNVGKSSLINMLTNRKKLAKTSGKPGKTRLINHFLINKNWFLVDLPGYGYALASKSEKHAFQNFITHYFKERKQLISAFLLIDIRHKPQPVDVSFMSWLNQNGLPFSMVFTKADKLKPAQQKENIDQYISHLLKTEWEEAPPWFLSSSKKKTGKTEILNYITQLNKLF